ncbi:MAG TPA: PAAR domain-containing protein [Accumulibacter sp.]|nr:PAAR domain-containing protein [Accumulibacter sp.]HMX23238.1 PAAR domain-containing protein [Accumulibacter sp.]HNG38628.1 PAAR domain-containing protein [Accumulibacter sp.]HNL13859.1 PAAR domain-containing protein [Accumulibacter sp.]
MGQAAARLNDLVTATDLHQVLVPVGPALVPMPLPHPFSGRLLGGVVPTVQIGGQPAAVIGSTALGQPPHLPTSPGIAFVVPPSNLAQVAMGSASVLIGGQPAARNGDIALTCNDPGDLPVGQVVAAGTVLFGG